MYKEGLKGLPDNISGLQEILMDLRRQVVEMGDTITGFEQENELLREQLRLLRLKMFCRISEKFEEESDNLQRLLFEDIESEEPEEETKDEDLVIKEHKRKKPG